MKRRMYGALVAAGLVSALIAGCGSSNTAATEAAKAVETAGTAGAESPAGTAEGAEAVGNATAGVIWYNFADTFIANARQCLGNVAAADGTIKISDADSQNDITVQDNNFNNFLTQKPKYLVITNINNPAADSIAKTCTDNGIVAIFANTTSPSDDAFA